MHSKILVATTITSLLGILSARRSGSLAVAHIVDQAKPYNAVQPKSTADLSVDELLWCHGSGLPADMTSLMKTISTLKDTDEYKEWLLCYYSVKISDLQHSDPAFDASFKHTDHSPAGKKIVARDANTESIVTVTVTTIPDYCTSSASVTVAGVSTGSVSAPAPGTESTPTAETASAPPSTTAAVSASTALASGTTLVSATAGTPVPASANATGIATAPATAANATSTAESAPYNSTAAGASSNSTLTVPVSSSSSSGTSKNSSPSTTLNAAATSSTKAPTSDTNGKIQLPILVTVLVALAGGMFCMT